MLDRVGDLVARFGPGLDVVERHVEREAEKCVSVDRKRDSRPTLGDQEWPDKDIGDAGYSLK